MAPRRLGQGQINFLKSYFFISEADVESFKNIRNTNKFPPCAKDGATNKLYS